MSCKELSIKHFEFWPARVFEAPYYAWLLILCVRHRLPPAYLAKANYALDHGEIGMGSKYDTQMAFPQDRFPATVLLAAGLSRAAQLALITEFALAHHWPVVLKPDVGAVGKGVIRLDSPEMVEKHLPEINSNYLLQAYCKLPEEFGVFYVNVDGQARITGINRKHFPTVLGDGRSTLGELARRHPRHTEHWPLFLQYLNLDEVPDAGVSVRLSFVGSHTMGCMFTDDTALRTDELFDAIQTVCAPQPGFNFGRLDVRAQSVAAFQAGEFVVIEVNGVASLPTHMFDPQNSLLRGYQIFLQHAGFLAQAASENRSQSMELMPLFDVWRRAVANHRLLNEQHERALKAVE